MAVSQRMLGAIEKSSWVRKMFEEGALRKQKFGAENVFDFSLGNPNLDPPVRFGEILKNLVTDEPSGIHGYMPNAGFLETRKAVADYLSGLNGETLSPGEIIMTVGCERIPKAESKISNILKSFINATSSRTTIEGLRPNCLSESEPSALMDPFLEGHSIEYFRIFSRFLTSGVCPAIIRASSKHSRACASLVAA